MVELCLMASHGCHPPHGFGHQELAFSRASDVRRILSLFPCSFLTVLQDWIFIVFFVNFGVPLPCME